MDYEKEWQICSKMIEKGGVEKYYVSNEKKGKLFVRDRLKFLFDDGIFVEDVFFVECMLDGLLVDGVVIGIGIIGGRIVCVMVNDLIVKVGLWGVKMVEKIICIQEMVEKLQCLFLYLVDLVGVRIMDQVDMFLGRRGVGCIFYN